VAEQGARQRGKIKIWGEELEIRSKIMSTYCAMLAPSLMQKNHSPSPRLTEEGEFLSFFDDGQNN
jgi:hypothetical protein